MSLVTAGKAKCFASNGHMCITCVQALCSWVRGLDGSHFQGGIGIQMRVGFGRDKKLSKHQLSTVILLFAVTHNPQNFHCGASAAFTHPRETSVVFRYWAGVKGKWKKKSNGTDVVNCSGNLEYFISILPRHEKWIGFGFRGSKILNPQLISTQQLF